MSDQSKPVRVLGGTKLEQMRSQGPSALNSYIYKSIIDAANSREIADQVATMIRKAV